MVACEQCAIWYHGNCVGATEEIIRQMEDKNEPFICPTCKKPGVVKFKFE